MPWDTVAEYTKHDQVTVLNLWPLIYLFSELLVRMFIFAGWCGVSWTLLVVEISQAFWHSPSLTSCFRGNIAYRIKSQLWVFTLARMLWSSATYSWMDFLQGSVMTWLLSSFTLKWNNTPTPPLPHTLPDGNGQIPHYASSSMNIQAQQAEPL